MVHEACQIARPILLQIVSVWVKGNSNLVTLKEKTQLLIKMNQNYESRLPTQTGLLSVYLDIILHVYTGQYPSIVSQSDRVI